ncbi:MAG: hypothetical protein K2N51_18905 [Lachnospiraceae bacterium]|nr:hypothetical protein [Lachnospiraceae bacterium]
MVKKKLRYGYEFITCPICKSKTFDYYSYSEWGWGIVEQHGYCNRCGYIIEQAYSPCMEAFLDVTKGFKNGIGEYVSKNIRKHKRIRRKLNLKNIEVNPKWAFYT